MGGKDFPVTKKDGTIETVFIRELGVNEFPRFAKVQNDEQEMIEFVCDKLKGFAQTLTLESHEALVEEIEKVNGDFFSRWLARRIGRQEKMMPGVREKLLSAALASSDTSPKSPLNAA